MTVPRRTKRIAVLPIILLAGFLVSRTTRFKTAVMYVFLGSKAPANIRWECVKQTESKVATKFTLPLEFDRKSKNGLREFWHFSYMRECLNNHGYEASGTTIPASQIITDSDIHTYQNTYAGFTVSTKEVIEIESDNGMDADYDDRIRHSNIKVGNQVLSIYTYMSLDDDIPSDEALNQITHIPYTQGRITQSAPIADTPLESRRITQDDGQQGLLLHLHEDKVLVITGPDIDPSFFQDLAHNTRPL